MIFNGAPRDLHVVEGHGVISKCLVCLIPFARSQHNVVRLSEGNGARDRRRAIRDLFITIRLKTLLDLHDDRVRLFFPRIVGSDDTEVGILIRDTTHQRPLLAIAIAAASEDDNKFTRPKVAQGLENIEQRVVGMRVINKDLKLPFRRDRF